MKKRQRKEEKVRQLTAEELEAEQKKYDECKKPIKIAWMIYGAAVILYLVNGFVASSMARHIPQQENFVDTLEGYKQTEEYNDFVTEVQKEAVNMLTAGQITVEEYQHIIDTASSDEKFEEFLRGLKDDEFVQETIAKYDNYEEQMNLVGKKYAGVSIASLSSLMVATMILAKYRFREMDIEETRKKRADAQAEIEWGF